MNTKENKFLHTFQAHTVTAPVFLLAQWGGFCLLCSHKTRARRKEREGWRQDTREKLSLYCVVFFYHLLVLWVKNTLALWQQGKVSIKRVKWFHMRWSCVLSQRKCACYRNKAVVLSSETMLTFIFNGKHSLHWMDLWTLAQRYTEWRKISNNKLLEVLDKMKLKAAVFLLSKGLCICVRMVNIGGLNKLLLLSLYEIRLNIRDERERIAICFK